MKALRLPAPLARSLIGFAHGAHANLRLRVSPKRSRAAGGAARAWTVVPPAVPARLPVAWTNTGSPRFPDGPSRAFAQLQDPGRTDAPWPITAAPMLPPRRRPRRLRQLELFRGLPLGFSTGCLRFKSPIAGTQARLASGWPARLYRAGVEPAGPPRKVSDHMPVLLSRAFPGATSTSSG